MFEVDILTNLPKNLTVGLQAYKLGCLMLEKRRNGKLLKEFEKSSNDCVQNYLKRNKLTSRNRSCFLIIISY